MYECIDSRDGACVGDVHLYTSLSGASQSYRCEGHYAAYVARVQPELDKINERYPDSPFAPSWFDPTYAGERWDDDDY